MLNEEEQELLPNRKSVLSLLLSRSTHSADSPTRRHALLVLGVLGLTNGLVIVSRIKLGPIPTPSGFF